MSYRAAGSNRLRHYLSMLMAFAVMTAAGCSDGDGNNNGTVLRGCADTGDCPSNPPLMIGGERPAMVQIPVDYDVTTRYPLVVVLHGRGATGMIQSAYFGLVDRVDTEDFVLVMPDGIVASDGRTIWNATPACCATTPEEAMIDDVGYIRGLIEEAAATYSIDATRVGLIGHSNGAFMAFTMACEASEVVTSIVGLAGSSFEDVESCQPATERVSVLAIHGDADETVPFEGIEGIFPGAVETAERYAMLAGCNTGNPGMEPARDVVGNIPGTETTVTTWPDCLAGTDVELWTIMDGPHIPFPWTPSAQDAFVDWMLEHPRG